MYQFSWLPGSLVQPEQKEAFAKLYSRHYGIWSDLGHRPGEHVSLTAAKLGEWLTADAHVVWATFFGEVVGYAIALRSNFATGQSVAWVTQLVVHEEHRHRDIGKRLLFSIWKFTDHSAWGVLSANPYAIRALEKATRRRCSPVRIKVDVGRLLKVGRAQVTYVKPDSQIIINQAESRINTEFFLDHSGLPEMLNNVQSHSETWTLGPLLEGWEWFAFTFRDQPQISINANELAEMMRASDQITHEAFSRMNISADSQRWAQHSEYEVRFMIAQTGMSAESQVLDFGCGAGRHSIEFAKQGMTVTAVDYIHEFVEHATLEAHKAGFKESVSFLQADCREVKLKKKFSFAVCLYDVVGTYAEQIDNLNILKNLCSHLKPGAQVLISVMNLELTKQNAVNWFAISKNPDALLSLPASTIMEQTGNIFDPKYYMIDSETDIVYRKEQFMHSDALPEELIVRDRRYTLVQIIDACTSVGLEVVWARRVNAGNWDIDQPEGSSRAKEILVFCRLGTNKAQQQLF